VALGARRDPEEVLAGFVAWLGEHGQRGAPELIGYERPSVGFSTETILVDIRRAGTAGKRDERLVLKLPPAGPAIFPTYDFALQARVQEAAATAGIPVPVPVQVEEDTRWVGSPFLVMPAIAGHIVDEMPVRDHWLTKAEPELSAAVHGRYLDVLADINRIDWRAGGLAEVVPERDNAAEITHWRDYLAWYGDGTVLVPTLVEALDWCEAHRPASEPAASFLWGDVRLGNVIFDEARTPVAVLDWEMATIGAAEHDLAWTLTLEAIQKELVGRRVTGFLDHDAAVARYEARLGRRVRDLDWYEIFAMVRSTAIMTRIAYLDDRAGRPPMLPIADNPVLGILTRRIAETSP
jgi:aminoglycoside phosphotransferase (APT) family kinase protein